MIISDESDVGAPGVFGLKTIKLIEPRLEGGLTLEQAFSRRRTEREFSDDALPPQTLSDLLWAACGVNRRQGPFGLVGRTAASASNSQEVDVYVALAEGAYRYEPASHSLIPVAGGDHRRLALAAREGAGGSNAPVRLIYVADINKLEHTAGFDEPGVHDPAAQTSYYYVDTGLIAGNVYLFAASRGLAAWFHNCDRPALAVKLGLSETERPLFGQTVGYPKAHRRLNRPEDRRPRPLRHSESDVRAK
jgi:nitroreductase